MKTNQFSNSPIGVFDSGLGGLTVLKSDYDKFKGADKDIQDLYEKLQYLRITVEFLTDVVSQLTWRHQTIKNIIEWRKFMAGS